MEALLTYTNLAVAVVTVLALAPVRLGCVEAVRVSMALVAPAHLAPIHCTDTSVSQT